MKYIVFVVIVHVIVVAVVVVVLLFTIQKHALLEYCICGIECFRQNV